MLKNNRRALLIIAGLLTASHNIAYANNDLSLEDDFEIVNSATLKHVNFNLNLTKDAVKTGVTGVSLIADGTEILAKAQLAFTKAFMFDVSGAWKDVEDVVKVGQRIANKVKQIPDTLNKAGLHLQRIHYYLDQAKDSKVGKAIISAAKSVNEKISAVASSFKASVSGWFGW